MSLEGNVESSGVLRGKLNSCDVLTMSAYGVAVKNGFEGTEEEWLASLKGEQGYKGERGYTVFPLIGVHISSDNGTIESANQYIASQGGNFPVHVVPTIGDMFCTTAGDLCYITYVSSDGKGGYNLTYRRIVNLRGPSGAQGKPGEDGVGILSIEIEEV